MDGAAGKMSKKRDGQERKTYQSYPSVPGRYTVPRGSHFSAFPVIIMWRNDTTEHDNNIQHCLQNTDHSATCMCVCAWVPVWVSLCVLRVSADVGAIGRHGGVARLYGHRVVDAQLDLVPAVDC